jgi:hypothetical protein
MRRVMVSALLCLMPLAAAAQTPAAPELDARLLPWLGCWRPVDRLSPLADGGRVCVVPDGTSGVRILTIVDERVRFDEGVMPDGVSRPFQEPGCTASRQAEWSGDGLRMYARGTLECRNLPSRRVSALSLMTAEADWVDVQVSIAGLDESVLVRRFRRTDELPPDPALLPADLLARQSQVALGARQTINQIIDASGHVEPRVIEAMLFETRTIFPLDRRQLLALDAAHVPPQVIDLMIALSFPEKFDVKRRGGPAGGGGPAFFDADDLFAFDTFVPWYPWGCCYYPGAPIIIGGGGDGGGNGGRPSAHGHVVNGVGYVQVVPKSPEPVNSGKSRGASSSGGGADSSSASDSSSGGSSGASSAGFSGGGGADTGRTAVPR